MLSTELRSCDCCVGTTTSERSDDLGGAGTVGTTTELDGFEGVVWDLLLFGDVLLRESRTVLNLSIKDGLGGLDGVFELEPLEPLELFVLLPVPTLLVRFGVLSVLL